MPPEVTSHERKHMEPERHDGLSDGTPDAEQAAASQERKAGGAGIPPGATIIPTKGGKAHKGRTKLTHKVVLPGLTETLQRRARFMRKATCAELARNVGGGACGILASALVKLASEDMALREATLAAGNVDLARRLGESARMHLLYSREIASKDGLARKAIVSADGNAPPGHEFVVVEVPVKEPR